MTAGRIDLTPQSYHAAVRRQVVLYRWAAVCIAYGLVLLIGYGLYQVLGPTYPNAQLQQRIDQLADQQAHFEKRIAEHRRQLQQLERQLAANRAVTDQPDWGLLLDLLARQTHRRLVLQAVHLKPVVLQADPAERPAGRTVATTGPTGPSARPAGDVVCHLELQGSARTQAEVSAFLLALENSGLFQQVELLDSRRDRLLNLPVIDFQIDCTFATDPEGKP